MATSPPRAAFASLSLAAAFASLTTGCAESTNTVARRTADLSTSALGLTIEMRSNGKVVQAEIGPHGRNGYVSLSEGDKLLFSVEGGKEIPLVNHDSRYICQVTTAATRFKITFVRGSSRFITSVELPPPFELSAKVGEDEAGSSSQPFTVSYAPTSETSEIDIEVRQKNRSLKTKPAKETGTFAFAQADLTQVSYNHSPNFPWKGMIVRATRTGGKATRPPGMASFEQVVRLEQIRAITLPAND